MIMETTVTSLKCLLMMYGSFKLVQEILNYLKKSKANPEPMERLGYEVDRRRPPDIWNTGYFFPDFDPRDPDSSASKVIHLLRSARVCLKVCLYLTSYDDFETIVLKKFQEGLIVQVLTCQETMDQHNNHFKRWINQGIEVRTRKTGYFMHHKFIIIDDEALLNGSLNWTRQGVMNNCENVLVTTDPRLVGAYKKEFSKLWNQGKEYEEHKIK